MQSELKLRIISGIVMAVAILAATWAGGLPFRFVAAAIGMLVYYEWSTITRLAERDMQGNAFGWLIVFFIALEVLVGGDDMSMPILCGGVITAALLVALRRRSWWLPSGILYAGLSAIALSAIRGDNQAGLVAMCFVFAVVWTTDILAYFVGRALKGPKLAPRISPGKTWSGAIGGAFFAVLGGSILAALVFPGFSLWTSVIALILSITSQMGDLFESFIKRRFGVKDSSRLIPGHGGVMDRVDGLVFACFTAYLLTLASGATKGHLDLSVAAFLFGLS